MKICLADCVGHVLKKCKNDCFTSLLIALNIFPNKLQQSQHRIIELPYCQYISTFTGRDLHVCIVTLLN